MEIRSISKNFFKTASCKAENNNNQTNPFGVSFKGSFVPADVFVPSSGKIGEAVTKKSKMVTSAIVGSINSLSQSLTSRLNSIVNYGRRMRENAANFWNNAKNTEIHLDFLNTQNIKNILNTNINEWMTNKMIPLNKRSVADLENMLNEAIVG